MNKKREQVKSIVGDLLNFSLSDVEKFTFTSPYNFEVFTFEMLQCNLNVSFHDREPSLMKGGVQLRRLVRERILNGLLNIKSDIEYKIKQIENKC